MTKTIKQLFLCEKPSQARDIARVLNCAEHGEGYLRRPDIAVSWCFGHLLENAAPDDYCENIKPWRWEILPVLPETTDSWKMIVKEKSKKQFLIIKELLKNTEAVVIATDADREGEVIAREILEFCKFKGGIKRLWLSALDDASIKKALNDIREGSLTENLYQAGLGRARADWIIGMNMSMAATISLHNGEKGSGALSVGRVQTPTLKLIVDRDKTIENFVSQNYFELIMQFFSKEKDSFYAKWEAPDHILDV